MSHTLHLRALEPRDWPHIWPIIEEICRAGETYTYPRDIDEAFAQTLWVQSPPGHTIVAHNASGDYLGTAKMGPNQMGPGGHVATASFMVSAPARGQGVGRKMGEYALNWARNEGYRAMQFNAVVASNTPAVKLWQDLGFAIVGTLPGAFDHPHRAEDDLYVMHQRLTPKL